jgi:Fe-S cluster biogenesis protein NfuA
MSGFEQELKIALQDLLPAMEPDGGGVEVISCGHRQVTLRLIGSCIFCPSRALSAAALEKGLLERMPKLESISIEYPSTKVPRAMRLTHVVKA